MPVSEDPNSAAAKVSSRPDLNSAVVTARSQGSRVEVESMRTPTDTTYVNAVQPGVDLTLDARRSGFEADFIVKQRPATAPVWRIPLRTQGLTARQAADGTIEFVDAKNVVQSRIPIGQMWDAVKDEHTGMPVNTAPVDVSVEQVSPGKATLVIAPDAEWFLDPARVFPVTVDPTYAVTTTLATFVIRVNRGVKLSKGIKKLIKDAGVIISRY